MNKRISVLRTAFAGLVKDVANILGITDKRLYELLGRDNPYIKLWRILKPLGKLNPDRLRIVQADFNSRCELILQPVDQPIDPAILHSKLSEAMQAVLVKASKEERKREILQAIAELNKQLQLCD